MSLPGVSFVMPIYNKAPWLPEVLAQIKAQRGNFSRQYVFVDDGSTDDSLALLQQITAVWDNVVIHSQDNAGSAAATNQGISLVNQPFVKFVDADDLLHVDATRILLQALLEAGPEACLAYGGYRRYDNRIGIDLDGPLVSMGPIVRIHRPLKQALWNSLFNPTQFLARTEALRQAGGCDERITFSQEFSLTMRLARLGDFIQIKAPVAYLPRTVEGRLSNNTGRQLQRVTRAVALFLQDYPDTPWLLKQQLCRRTAYRAWKFKYRSDHAFWLSSPDFWRQVWGYLPRLSGHAAFIERCAQVFDTADERAVGLSAKQEG